LRVVEEAVLYPTTCAVTGRSDGPFVDCGVTIPPGPDFRIYLLAQIVKEAASKLDMVPASDLIAAHEEIERLEKKAEKDAKAVEAAHRLLDAVAEARKTRPRKKVAA
jgi:hypothetical protein